MYCHYIGWCIGKCPLYRGVLYQRFHCCVLSCVLMSTLNSPSSPPPSLPPLSLHNFHDCRSLELARCTKLLSGYSVYLSPSIKPAPNDMTDIIQCSGGVVLTTLPDPPGVGVLIVASPDDLSMLSRAMEAGVAVYSTELILSGILRQELDLQSYPKNPLPVVYWGP